MNNSTSTYSYPIGPNTLMEEIREQLLINGYSNVETIPGLFLEVSYP